MRICFATTLIITLFLSSCSNSEEVENGNRLYDTFCISCHGTDGGLRMAGAPDLAKSILSFEDKVSFISMGSPKGTMMPFAKEHGGQLSQEDIESIVSYIETFK